MLNYVLFVLSLALCGVQGQRTTANIARAASSYLADIASSKVKTLNSVKTDIDVGNIKLPIPKGAPGVDMELSKYIAQAWRSAHSSEVLLFSGPGELPLTAGARASVHPSPPSQIC